MALDNKQNISVGRSFLQDSSFRHVTGSAAYIDDIPLPKNCLHGALVLSDTASGTITSLDLKDVIYNRILYVRNPDNYEK